MPANVYNFVDRWSVDAPADAVWDLLAKPATYPDWWRGVYLDAKPINGDELRVGARCAVVARGWLPYKLRFTVETTALDRPKLIEFSATGDFETDASRWHVKDDHGRTRVTLEWSPLAIKPIVRLLSPLLKPALPLEPHLGDEAWAAGDQYEARSRVTLRCTDDGLREDLVCG